MLLLLVLASSLHAATIPVCASGCGAYSPVTRATIQAAVDAATCGDTVTIQAGSLVVMATGPIEISGSNKNCSAANPFTLTTDLAAWLPTDLERVTPSYLPLMPVLKIDAGTTYNNMPLISADRNLNNASGIVVRGIAMQQDPRTISGAPYSFATVMLQMGDMWVCDTTTTYSSDLTIKHNLFLSTSPTTQGDVGGGAYLGGRGVQFLGNWIDDSRCLNTGGCSAAEIYGIHIRNGGQDYQIRNNYFGTGLTEDLMLQANGPLCQYGLVVPLRTVVEHNTHYRSKKWYEGTATYLGTKGFIKNFQECKACDYFISRFNAGYNQWGGAGQYYAYGMGPRILTQQSGPSAAEAIDSCPSPASDCGYGAQPVIAPLPHPLRVCMTDSTHLYMCYESTPWSGTFNTECTVGTCTYYYPWGFAPGGGMALATVANPGALEFERQTIATVTDQFHFIMAAPYVRAVANGIRWVGVAEWNRVSHVSIYGNFFQNVAQDVNFLASDYFGGGGGTTAQFQYINNITANTDLEFMTCTLSGCPAQNSMQHLAYSTVNGFQTVGLMFDHNTRFTVPGIAPARNFMQIADVTLDNRLMDFPTYGSPTGNYFQYTNNLRSPTIDGNPQSSAIGSNTPDDASIRYGFNSYTGGGITNSNYVCAGARKCGSPASFYSGTYDSRPVVTNTFAPGFRNMAAFDFSVLPSSVFRLTGQDARDVGADQRAVALIQYPTVTTLGNAAMISYRVTEPLAQKPCQIEVGTSSGLVDDLSTYTPLNAVNPAYFIRGDSDASDASQWGVGSGTAQRSFTMCQNASVADDTAAHTSRDLSCATSTTYYYRLSCNGPMVRGSFTTAAAASTGTTSLSIAARALSPATKVRIDYGVTAASLTTGTSTACASGCTIALSSVARGRPLVTRIVQLDNSDVVLATGSIRAMLVQ